MLQGCNHLWAAIHPYVSTPVCSSRPRSPPQVWARGGGQREPTEGAMLGVRAVLNAEQAKCGALAEDD